MNGNYYTIKRLNDDKFLYKIKDYWSGDLNNKPIKTPCFTKSSDVCFLESLELAEDALNIVMNFKKNQTKKPISQLKSNYEIIEISLLEKTLTDQIINAKRGEFLFKIKDADCNSFIQDKATGPLSSLLFYSQNGGKLFVEHSVAQTYKKYLIQDFYGFYGCPMLQQKKQLKKRFKTIAFKPQAYVYKKILLIEKIKPKKKRKKS